MAIRFNVQEQESKINLTPMLDVVFIMLIFFIVTATFINETGLPIPDQKQAAEPDPKKAAIVVELTENDRIFVAGKYVDVRLVRANIERLRAANPEASVVVRAHSRSSVNSVVGVMDSARSAGVYSVQLAKKGV